ncbi:MAG: hypothetical protein IKS41_04970 [Alphaproteobacteria bacterium]|nr:hypothetical protein [Alphaproteobacteria bacterium]
MPQKNKKIEKKKTITVPLFILLSVIALAICGTEKTCEIKTHTDGHNLVTNITKTSDCSITLFGLKIFKWQDEEQTHCSAFSYCDTFKNGKLIKRCKDEGYETCVEKGQQDATKK